MNGALTMARHPEVKEKEIIEAALALEKLGKIPNPGAIRAKLGFKGGLVRIRNVWDKHLTKRSGNEDEKEDQLSLEDLPSDLADAAQHSILMQKKSFEQIVTLA